MAKKESVEGGWREKVKKERKKNKKRRRRKRRKRRSQWQKCSPLIPRPAWFTQ